VALELRLLYLELLQLTLVVEVAQIMRQVLLV
jgi:hypothetical protein